jgi:hypothetical protein
MIRHILVAHRDATAAVRTHRIINMARLRSSRYHHAALLKIAQPLSYRGWIV